MTREELRDLLHKSIVNVMFIKKNNEERFMQATLQLDYINKLPPTLRSSKPSRNNPNIIVVVDVEKMAWHSFDWNTIVDIQVQS